jgi:hypothetical protein
MSSNTLPVIDEITVTRYDPKERRQSRLSNPIRQFKHRGEGSGTGDLSQATEKLFSHPIDNKSKNPQRNLITRKPSTDDIDIHPGRSYQSTPTAWDETPTSELVDHGTPKKTATGAVGAAGGGVTPMSEKEKRKKIFRRLRSKSFDNVFEGDDRSPSPLPSTFSPAVVSRPASTQKNRPNSHSHSSRPSSSPSRRQNSHTAHTPSRTQSKSLATSSSSSSPHLKTQSKDTLPSLSSPSQESKPVIDSRRSSSARPSRLLLRSGSKDDMSINYQSNSMSKLLPSSSPSLPSAADISPVAIASPILLRSTPQVFWRCRLNAMIHIYHHPSYRSLEFIAINLLTGQELPHVYVDLVRVLEIMEEQVLKESYAEKRSQRSQLLQSKSIICAVDYLLVLLDADYAKTSDTSRQSTKAEDAVCEMNLRRYIGQSSPSPLPPLPPLITPFTLLTAVAETSAMEDLLIKKPPALHPVVLPLELRNQRVVPKDKQETLSVTPSPAPPSSLSFTLLAERARPTPCSLRAKETSRQRINSINKLLTLRTLRRGCSPSMRLRSSEDTPSSLVRQQSIPIPFRWRDGVGTGRSDVCSTLGKSMSQ